MDGGSAYDDVDAEGEVDGGSGGEGMTLVSAGGLATLGLAPPSSVAASGGVGKRYRPAPAKTFQCRGYGECRMVFSRSEHLARHIRKHTGERPFACHCSKQFSRLDNLRQHAQTVHADRAELNEAMMRELTSLHASMTGSVVAGAGAASASASASAGAGSGSGSGGGAGTGGTPIGGTKKTAGKRASKGAANTASATTTTANVSANAANANASPTSPSTGAAATSTSTSAHVTENSSSSSTTSPQIKREPDVEAGAAEAALHPREREQPKARTGVTVRARPGTSTGYEGAADGGGMDMGGGGGYRVGMEMDMDVDGDGEEGKGKGETRDAHRQEPSPPQGGARSFRGDVASHTAARNSITNAFGAAYRPRAADDAQHYDAYGTHRAAQSFLGAGAGAAGGGQGQGQGQSFLAAGGPAHPQTHSGGSGQSFRGHPYARRSPPQHTPSPPAAAVSGISSSRVASGGSFSFQSGGRPFSSGTGTFPATTAADGPFQSTPSTAFPGSFPGPLSTGSGSRPGSGARLPPLSAVVSAAAFRPSSGHGVPAPGTSGSILLPNSLTLRRPSTGDWEWDAWSVRPGTAPGKLATAAAANAGEDSPFSFHPPEQPAAAFVGSGNPRKRAFGGPDGPYGAHPDNSSGGGGYQYGSDSRPASRRLSVYELLCNDDAPDQRPASSSLAVSVLRAGSAERERERERPTTTNGLVSRASALVLHDRDQQPRERELESGQQHPGEQRFAADLLALGGGGTRSRPGSVRGRDAAAPGGAAAAGARAGAGGRGDGGVPTASGGSTGAGGFLPPSAAAGSAGAGAAYRGGALPHAAAAAAAGADVSRSVRAASPPAVARARDGYGLDADGSDGDDGGISTASREYGVAPAGHGGGGRISLSLSPPAPYRGGFAGAGLSGGFAGVPHAAPAASASAFAFSAAPASPPSASAQRARAPSVGGLPGVAVFARVPAYAAGLPLRGDDALLGVRRRDDGLRYAPGGHAEVRELAAGAGRGPGAGGYEYEYEHEHGHRVGGGRSGGMRV